MTNLCILFCSTLTTPPVALCRFRPGVPRICFTQILKICLTQMLNNLEPFLSNAKSERRVFQMFGVQALPPLPSPHCAKKGHLWSSADKKGGWGVFYKKEKQTRAVSALGELPYTPKQDAAWIWNKLVAEIILIINFLPIKKPTWSLSLSLSSSSSSCNDHCFDKLAVITI